MTDLHHIEQGKKPTTTRDTDVDHTSDPRHADYDVMQRIDSEHPGWAWRCRFCGWLGKGLGSENAAHAEATRHIDEERGLRERVSEKTTTCTCHPEGLPPLLKHEFGCPKWQGKTTTPTPIEWCRRCRDLRYEDPHHQIQPAEFVVWGKLFNRESLGPRCYDCAAEQIGHSALRTRSGYAVLDLRGLTRA